MVPIYSLLDMNNVCWYVSVWKLSYCCADLWLLRWTRQDRERFYVSSATMVIKISRVHSPVVKAADCRSAGPWFNSGWRSCIAFMTCSDKKTNHTAQRNNIKSPITTSIRTITRKSVNEKHSKIQHLRKEKENINKNQQNRKIQIKIFFLTKNKQTKNQHKIQRKEKRTKEKIRL